MESRAVGASGLRVSRLGLGTLTWGRDTDEHEAAEQLSTFLDAGGSLIDTAAASPDAEGLLGGLMADVDRDDIVIAGKAGLRRTDSGLGTDTSRRGLLAQLDGSLRRLGTDHLDLWSVHAWSDDVPLEEVLATLDQAVSSGRVRYAGVSNYSGWQTAAAAVGAQAGGLPLVATSVEYSLLARGVEREVIPACQTLGLGVLAWSPLGRGVLTGKYRHGIPADSRGAAPHFSGFVEPYLGPTSGRVVAAVCTAAEGLGVAPLEVALAWLLSRPAVSSAVVGARTAAQLKGVMAVDTLELPAEIQQALDEVSEPAMGYPERARGGR
jgi:aryl-alcohol dehydrogenase-like predicted oxidoreductase